MPCNMYEGVTSAELEAQAARSKADEAMAAADKVTDILCRVLRALPPEIVANMDPDVRAWFEQHTAHDAKHGR